jgi:Ca2+-binding RTX toxin-like protein
VATVVADDANLPAGDSLSFSLITASGDSYSGPFEIVKNDAGSAYIRVIGALDLEPEDTQQLFVKVIDSIGNSTLQNITIEVLPGNLAPTDIVFQEFSSVDENSDGAIASNSVTVTDPEDASSTFTASDFSLSDDRFEIFDFGGGALVVKLKDGEVLDYESGEHSIDIDVTVTDSGGLDHTETLTIAVNNVNEGPGGTGGLGVQAATMEQGSTETPLGLVAPVDPDGDDLTFTVNILPANGTVFLNSVALTANQPLTAAQFEALTYSSPEGASGTFSLQFVVEDGNGSVDAQDITLNVIAGTNSVLTGTTDVDRLDGAFGDDIVSGLGDDDTLIGGTGNDTLIGGQGGDALLGGAGSDTASYAGAAVGVSISLATPGSNTGEAAGDSFNSIENVTGSTHADFIEGNGGTNVLRGGGGADVLQGLAGNDTYYVDSADDTVVEGTGQGTADLVATSVSYVLSAAAQVETLRTTSNGGTAAIDLTGNSFNQTIIGNNGVNILRGGGGTDVLQGLGDNDTYFVDSADDTVIEGSGQGTADLVATNVSYVLSATAQVETLRTTSNGGTMAINLTGNAVAQTVTGNAGVNVINGGLGNDKLAGLGGDDFFVFNTALGSQNVDTITDFNYLSNDTFQFDDAVFGGIGGTGALNANFFVAATHALDSTDHIIYDRSTGALFYDADANGIGAAIQFATLANKVVLTASDFQVI